MGVLPSKWPLFGGSMTPHRALGQWKAPPQGGVMDHRTQLPAVGPQGSQNGHIFDDFDRFLPFPRGSIGKLSFSSLIRRVFFQKFMKNDPFLGGVQLGGGPKSVSSGIGREFRALSAHYLCMLSSDVCAQCNSHRNTQKMAYPPIWA